MARSITDNPGGWSRSLPGHTVEYEPGFAHSFYYGGSLSIGAGGNSTYTLSIIDTEHIFFADMVSVSPQAYKEFAVVVYVNDVPYVSASGIGWLNIPLRQNPSIQLISGDHLDVYVVNQDGSTRTFLVKVNGTSIVRPAGFGHAPAAYWTADTHAISKGGHIHFTDGSGNTPIAWEWDFDDGSDKSTDQNPVHTYSLPGSYYPRLKAVNAYGVDYYAESTPIVVT